MAREARRVAAQAGLPEPSSAAEARRVAAEAFVATDSVAIRDAREKEVLLQTQEHGTRLPSFRLICLARVVDNVVNTTADCAEAILQGLGEGSVDTMEVRNLRYLGRQLCAMATTDAVFDFLAPIANIVIGVSTKAMKMELPLEELREILRQARDEVAAVRDHKVNLDPRRRMVESAHFADVGGDMTVSSLAEVKVLAEQFSNGRLASANSTVVLGGMLLQEASTVCYILDRYERSIANWKPLEVLASLDDCLTLAVADIENLISILDANGYAYKVIPKLLGDDEQLRGIIPDIEASRGMWFPFTAPCAPESV